jgi:hypothetical protein
MVARNAYYGTTERLDPIYRHVKSSQVNTAVMIVDMNASEEHRTSNSRTAQMNQSTFLIAQSSRSNTPGARARG